jgi:endonuclease/exonuclease/phosphatase family metal-dependent hydrolase
MNASPHPPVRVLGFNLRYDTTADGSDAWEHRRDDVVRFLRYHRPDVCCLQEALAHQFDYLRDRLDRYDWVGVGREDGDRGGEHVPVGYDAERFDRVETDAFWLSESPEAAGSVGWDAEFPRVVTRVSLRDVGADAADPLHLASVHLDHRGERAQAESASLLRRRLGRLDGPVVVAGDCNCTPGSEPYRRLTAEDGDGAPFRDAKRVSGGGHHGPDGTFHGFTGDPGERIDYVFVRGCDVDLHATLTDRISEGYPSDHFAVAADVVPRR